MIFIIEMGTSKQTVMQKNRQDKYSMKEGDSLRGGSSLITIRIAVAF